MEEDRIAEALIGDLIKGKYNDLRDTKPMECMDPEQRRLLQGQRLKETVERVLCSFFYRKKNTELGLELKI